MKIRTGATIVAGAVLLQCIYAGPAGAYNPNEDPNVTQPGAERSSSRNTQVLSLVEEFERLQPGNTNPSYDRSLDAASQPAQYTGSDSQPAPAAQPFPDPYYLWDGYSYRSPRDQFFWNGRHHRIPAWRHSSPRIPWWSLLRFTKH